MNHVYHHRGQLSVYLRLLNVPVPSIYGPSADEGPAGQVRRKLKAQSSKSEEVESGPTFHLLSTLRFKLFACVIAPDGTARS